MPRSFGPIQQFPQGLLSFLQIKSNGQYPRTVTDEYAPSLDLIPWLLQTNAQDENTWANVAIGTVGMNSPGVTYPGSINDSGEFGFYQYAGFRFANGANVATCRMCLSINQGVANVESFHALTDPVAVAANQTVLVTARDFWLPPNGRLGLWFDVWTAGGNISAGFFRLDRIQV